MPDYSMLSPDEELVLARAWRTRNDLSAADRLVTSHLRLAAKIAVDYRGYGLPLSELVSEGSVGLSRAVRCFDPERGFRLSTYATWWIQATIQKHLLNSFVDLLPYQREAGLAISGVIEQMPAFAEATHRLVSLWGNHDQ
jgi:RNA polymerase sigma factor (sigma-70 family)